MFSSRRQVGGLIKSMQILSIAEIFTTALHRGISA
jgi:hypothetical protein